MNKVFLSGRIATRPELRSIEGQAPHLIFFLSVSCKLADGEICRDLYRINAWNKRALWGYGVLKRGQAVTVEGYLSQREVKSESGTLKYVEITAIEFFLGRERTTSLITPNQQGEEKEKNDGEE